VLIWHQVFDRNVMVGGRVEAAILAVSQANSISVT